MEQGICEMGQKVRRKKGRCTAADKQGIDGFIEFVLPVFGFLDYVFYVSFHLRLFVFI